MRGASKRNREIVASRAAAIGSSAAGCAAASCGKLSNLVCRSARRRFFEVAMLCRATMGLCEAF